MDDTRTTAETGETAERPRIIQPGALKRWIGEAEHIGYDIVETAEVLKEPNPPARRLRELGFARDQLRRAKDDLGELIQQIEAALLGAAP